eukprot:Selendium_serpulae@DN6131_c0_g1_i3.p1
MKRRSAGLHEGSYKQVKSSETTPTRSATFSVPSDSPRHFKSDNNTQFLVLPHKLRQRPVPSSRVLRDDETAVSARCRGRRSRVRQGSPTRSTVYSSEQQEGPKARPPQQESPRQAPRPAQEPERSASAVRTSPSMSSQSNRVESRHFDMWKRTATLDYAACFFWEFEWPVGPIDWVKMEGGVKKKKHHKNSSRETRASADRSTDMQRCVAGTRTRGESQAFVYVMDISMSYLDEGNDGQAPPATDDLVVVAKIPHPNDVQCCKSCPSNPDLLASVSCDGPVFVFNWRKYPPSRSVTEFKPAKPDVTLRNTPSNPCSLRWSKVQPELICCGGTDGRIAVWNAAVASNGPYSGSSMPLVEIAAAHDQSLSFVDFDCWFENVLLSAGGDGHFKVWDIRCGERKKKIQSVQQSQAHLGACSSISQNPIRPNILATVGKDPFVTLWDTRNLSSAVHKMHTHARAGCQVAFAPFNDCTFLASSHDDNSIILWDVARIGAEVEPSVFRRNDPEYVFQHTGHRSPIFDFSWNSHEGYQWFILSTEEGNKRAPPHFMVWQMAERFYIPEDEGFVCAVE